MHKELIFKCRKCKMYSNKKRNYDCLDVTQEQNMCSFGEKD